MIKKCKMLFLLTCVLLLAGCGKVKEDINIVYGEQYEIRTEKLNSYSDLEWVVDDVQIATITDATLATTTDIENMVVVTGLAPGKTTINAKFEEKCVATYNVEVSIIPITSIVLSTNSIEIEEGETAQLNYTLYPENASDYGLEWKSADAQIVEVDENGNINAVSVGQTTVTISNEEGLIASCNIIVKQKNAYDRLTSSEKKIC